MTAAGNLVLRLASPLQSWGAGSQYNRRETAPEPTKGGVLGLLAAAEGRRRSDPIEDLVGLQLGVRTDQAGSVLRDYHTVSDYRIGRPLLSASVDRKGRQKLTSPAKHTHVTQRFYLQDAVFVAAIHGPLDLLERLADAVCRPVFPLSLGRRSCPPTLPLLLPSTDDRLPRGLHDGTLLEALTSTPWQASDQYRAQRYPTGRQRPATMQLPVTVDDPSGDDVRTDVPASFVLGPRTFRTRRVRSSWCMVPTGFPDGVDDEHDPFALLGA